LALIISAATLIALTTAWPFGPAGPESGKDGADLDRVALRKGRHRHGRHTCGRGDRDLASSEHARHGVSSLISVHLPEFLADGPRSVNARAIPVDGRLAANRETREAE
jgi:hypothetical protein